METFSIEGPVKEAKAARKTAIKLGFRSSRKPDFVIVIGGHGTFFSAEKRFPEIPKLLFRTKHLSNLPSSLKKIREGEFKLIRIHKLEAWIKGKKLEAVNDIVIRNRDIMHAIRFDLSVKGGIKHIIGDGIVAATRYGSTGYFYSVCRRRFKSGFGVAINNPIKREKPIFFHDGFTKLKIVRGRAALTVDSYHSVLLLGEHDTVTIRKSSKSGFIIDTGTDNFRRTS